MITFSALTHIPRTSKSHADSFHPLYRNFYLMHYRTKGNSFSTSHQRYVEKGITVCDRWNDYDTFIADMYPTYTEGYVLDRIDNDGDYTPDNCQWLTRGQNAQKELNQPIHRYTLLGEYLDSFDSRTIAGNVTGVNMRSICRAAIECQPTGGFRWHSTLHAVLPDVLIKLGGNISAPIKQMSLDKLTLIKEWESAKEASVALGINTSSITSCLSGKYLTGAGYYWEYVLDRNTGLAPKVSERQNQVNTAIIQLKVGLLEIVINTYLDEAEASQCLDIKPSHIKRSILTGGKVKGHAFKVNLKGEVVHSKLETTLTEVAEYPSVVAGAKAVSCAASNITAVLKGKKKTSGGYSWKYKL